MGRRAAYQVRLEDGREIGFGLVIRDEVGTYSVQFRDKIAVQTAFPARRIVRTGASLRWSNAIR